MQTTTPSHPTSSEMQQWFRDMFGAPVKEKKPRKKKKAQSLED